MFLHPQKHTNYILGPLVLFVIFTQRHLVDFLGISSGKTKQSVILEIEFVSHFNWYYFKL